MSAGCCWVGWGVVAVVMLQGRFHLYEGNDPGLVVQPVLLFQALGARIVVLTNAAGGLDPSFGPGTLMVMTDHINLTGRNPLIGPNADELGAAVPRPDRRLEPAAARSASMRPGAREGVELREGVYVGLTGPTYETPAEVRMLAALGGHAVGMSTVLECIAARWVGLEVCGVSLVTNAGAGLHRRAADPRGGPGGRGDGRPAPRARDPPVPRGSRRGRRRAADADGDPRAPVLSRRALNRTLLGAAGPAASASRATGARRRRAPRRAPGAGADRPYVALWTRIEGFDPMS